MTSERNDIDTGRLLAELAAGRWVFGFSKDVAMRLREVEDTCHRLNLMSPLAVGERDAILRTILGSAGADMLIHSPFRCDFGFNIHIGDNFTANYGLTILDEARVTIGDRVFIGPNVNIYTVVHALLPEQRAAGVMTARPVTIADDVWIAGNVTILPGVSIGCGAVIGAGSTVTRDVAPMTLVAGNPAREIRPLTDADRIEI